MKYDTPSLEAEMQIAGITAHRDWRSDGTASTQDRPLTPAEQATAAQVLAAHDPTKRQREQTADDTERRGALANLVTAHRDWDTLGTAARWAAVRLVIRVVLLIAKRLLQ